MPRLPRIAFAAFFVTVLVSHLALDRARPWLARLARAHQLIGPHDVGALDPDARRSRVAVAGTSLTAGLALQLDRLGLDALNRNMPGGLVADEFASALEAERTGADAIVFELNPYLWNERVHLAYRGPSPPVARDDRHAAAIWPWARRSVRWSIAKQLGWNGALERLAERFSPLAVRASRLPDAWFPPLVDVLTPRLTVEVDGPSPELCENWRNKHVDGLDDEVLGDFLAWTRQARARVLVVLPPLNLPLIEACGSHAGARLAELQAHWRRRLAGQGLPFVDLTRMAPAQGFVDFGHLRSQDDFAPIAAAVAAPLRALASGDMLRR
jgi:hypothetical protein